MQVIIVANDDTAAPGISIEVADVDAVHAAAVEQGFEIVYPLRDEDWGVRRFMLREPSGTIDNVLSHGFGLNASCCHSGPESSLGAWTLLLLTKPDAARIVGDRP